MIIISLARLSCFFQSLDAFIEKRNVNLNRGEKYVILSDNTKKGALRKRSSPVGLGVPAAISMDKTLALKTLSRDPVLHMDMVEAIRSGNAELLFVSESGVLLRHTLSPVLMMSANDPETAGRMLAAADSTELFVAHQSFTVEMVLQKFPYRGQMPCRQAVYLKNEPLPSVPSPEIKRLDERFLPFIMEHYSHDDDEDYQLERLRSGVMFGAFVDGRPAGFIGMHTEGSIGMLEVLPEFRRRGIALALETFYVNRLLSEGRVPYSQIELTNAPSFALHRKLDFEISANTLTWLME